jgi:hypothetical protein
MKGSNMKHSTLTNAIAAFLGNEARTCTRYNGPITSEPEHDTKITYDLVPTKLVVSEFANDTSYNTHFTVRMLELCNETVVPTKEMAMAKISEDDPLFSQFNYSRTEITPTCIQEALQWAGMEPRYSFVLEKLAKIIDGFAAKDRGVTGLGASGKFGNEGVAFFAQLHESVLIIRFEA